MGIVGPTRSSVDPLHLAQAVRRLHEVPHRRAARLRVRPPPGVLHRVLQRSRLQAPPGVPRRVLRPSPVQVLPADVRLPHNPRSPRRALLAERRRHPVHRPPSPRVAVLPVRRRHASVLLVQPLACPAVARAVALWAHPAPLRPSSVAIRSSRHASSPAAPLHRRRAWVIPRAVQSRISPVHARSARSAERPRRLAGILDSHPLPVAMQVRAPLPAATVVRHPRPALRFPIPCLFRRYPGSMASNPFSAISWARLRTVLPLRPIRASHSHSSLRNSRNRLLRHRPKCSRGRGITSVRKAAYRSLPCRSANRSV